MEEELLDWELLHGSDMESFDSITSEKESVSSSVFDDGMIFSDHFSVDTLIETSGETSDPSLLKSGDSSRVDYGLDPEEVRVGLDVDRSGDGDFEAVEEKHFERQNVLRKSLSESDDIDFANGSGVEEHIEELSKSWCDSRGFVLVCGDSRIVNGEDEIASDSVVASTNGIGGNTVQDGAENSCDESKRGEIVWWKIPLVFLKHSASKIGPIWSVSLTAALMGLLLLEQRRLYDMKKKAQRFNLKVAINDKKVSLVMNQETRFNEMFTSVSKVPLIRPDLPSPDTWPLLSLR